MSMLQPGLYDLCWVVVVVVVAIVGGVACELLKSPVLSLLVVMESGGVQ